MFFRWNSVGFQVLNLWTLDLKHHLPSKTVQKTDGRLPKPIYASWHSASLLVGQQSSGRTIGSPDELLQGRCMSSLFTVGPPPACLTCHQPHRLLTPQTWVLKLVTWQKSVSNGIVYPKKNIKKKWIDENWMVCKDCAKYLDGVRSKRFDYIQDRVCQMPAVQRIDASTELGPIFYVLQRYLINRYK